MKKVLLGESKDAPSLRNGRHHQQNTWRSRKLSRLGKYTRFRAGRQLAYAANATACAQSDRILSVFERANRSA